MNIELFLKEDERIKLSIIRYLEGQPETFIKVSFFCEILGIKSAKLVKLLEELETELKEYNGKPKIEKKGLYIESRNLSLQLIKEVQLSYLQNNPTFLYFKDLLKEKVTPQIFCKKYFFSEGSGFARQKIIRTFFSNYDINVKNGFLVGSELKIRNLYFSFFYEVYEGIDSPFSKDKQKFVNDFIQLLTNIFDLKISYINKIKLELLLGILISRLQNNCYISEKEDYFLFEDANDIWNIIEEFIKKRMFVKEAESLFRELKYILGFIKYEGMDDVDILIKTDNFKESDYISELISDSILLKIKPKEKNRIEQFKNQIKEINRSHKIFDFILYSFSSKTQLQMIHDAYPYLSTAISTTLDEYKDQLHLSNFTAKNQLFYKYTYLTKTLYLASDLRQPVYVYVDFSLGELYTQYISEEVKNMKDLNIHIQKDMSTETDIYLSDCISYNSGVKTVIWKKNPTAEDWRKLRKIITLIYNHKNDL
ncbi:helix-turn-helix domain-containing protein [Enterococcus sp. C76]|uniref:helix-turn-helix domain-containing protein n=1 Tax=Enterococcus sp. C76 TaxID=3231334 RepID=UPI0034A08496